MKIKLEKDTAKVVDEQSMWKDGCDSEFYKQLKKRFIGKVVENSSLLRIQIAPNSTSEATARELTARALLGTLAIQMLTEIEGEAAQYDYNMKLLTNAQEDEILRFFPEKVEG